MPTTEPLESAVVAAIRKNTTKRGAYVVKTQGTPLGLRGTPDLLLCYRGHFLAIEVKRRSRIRSGVSRLQAANLILLERAGALTLVTADAADIELVLDTIDAADEANRTTPIAYLELPYLPHTYNPNREPS